jgi:hypothetical protein
MNVDPHLNPSLPTNKPSSSEIIYRLLDELRPDPANPRCHSRKQVRQIAQSVKAFGFNVPILIDRDGNVVAGHGRLAACRELGMTQAPTLCLDHLTPAQLRAFRSNPGHPIGGVVVFRRVFKGQDPQIDLGHVKTRDLEAEIEPKQREVLELFGEQPVVPGRDLGQPVVGDAESPQLSRGQVIEAQRRRRGARRPSADSRR